VRLPCLHSQSAYTSTPHGQAHTTGLNDALATAKGSEWVHSTDSIVANDEDLVQLGLVVLRLRHFFTFTFTSKAVHKMHPLTFSNQSMYREKSTRFELLKSALAGDPSALSLRTDTPASPNKDWPFQSSICSELYGP